MEYADDVVIMGRRLKYVKEVPYFSIDNAHPKLFWHSFWCIDNAHDAN